ncbi:hypothetical protein STXM2123_5843 [Streptomyces sp. F-3]|nr:hypothetical protein STXM2123_5843 [Streptomyces sp. F-3]
MVNAGSDPSRVDQRLAHVPHHRVLPVPVPIPPGLINDLEFPHGYVVRVPLSFRSLQG